MHHFIDWVIVVIFLHRGLFMHHIDLLLELFHAGENFLFETFLASILQKQLLHCVGVLACGFFGSLTRTFFGPLLPELE